MRNLLTSTLLLTTPLLATEPLYRVAFDLGSGKVKMQAALVDDLSKQIIKSVKSSEIQVLLREAIDQDSAGCISEEMIQKLLFAIKELQKEADLPQVSFKSAGIGTEPFRVAKNGEEVLKILQKETGISLSCLSPEEEALLGLQALRAEKKVGTEDHFISWEIGGGSTQMAYIKGDNVQFFTKSIAKVPVKNYILKTIQGKDSQVIKSPNPISWFEVEAAFAWLKEEFKEAPSWLLHNPNLKVIGHGAMFPHIKRALQKTEFTKEEILALLSERVGKTDLELLATLPPEVQRHGNETFIVSDLIFLYSVMDKFGITTLSFKELEGPGSTSGLLIDADRWK